MAYTRRNFIRQSATYGTYGLLLSHMIACKSGNKKIAETTMEELKKQLTLAADAPYKMDYLRGNVGIFNERGGTIGWMASEDGLVVVDTQFPDQSKNVVAELQKITDHKMDLLINTHHHGDHTAGNSVYAELTDRILAHENSKANQMRVAKEREQEGQVFPNDTFADVREEKIGGESIKLHYYGPAHTDGDAIIHFQNTNVAHMGDLVFNRRFPYIDKSSGADISNWINVLDKSTTIFDDECIYIYGHCGEGYDVIGGKEEIKAFINYLEKLLEFGNKSIAEGKTLEELKEIIKVIPGAEEWKGGGIERSLDAVYAELNG